MVIHYDYMTSSKKKKNSLSFSLILFDEKNEINFLNQAYSLSFMTS